MIKTFTKLATLLTIILLFASCVVSGQDNYSYVDLTLKTRQNSEASGKFKNSLIEIENEYKASFYVEATADDLEQSITAKDYLLKDSGESYMAVTLTVPSGSQRKFTAVLFTVDENIFSAYQTNTEMAVDLEDGENKTITLEVMETLYGTAVAKIDAFEDDYKLYLVDKQTSIKLYSIKCQQSNDLHQCNLPRIPVKRELVPAVFRPYSEDIILDQKSFSIDNEGEEYKLELSIALD